ncbi:MAG: enolase C-terminal domain-like protein [Opitutales bacterium]
MPDIQLSYKTFDLQMRDSWSIASRQGVDGAGLSHTKTVFVKLEDKSGVLGIGEASPVPYYNESPETLIDYFKKIDRTRLDFTDPVSSESYIAQSGSKNFAAKCALSSALWNGAGISSDNSLCTLLNLPDKPLETESSFTIGLDTPEVIERKTADARSNPLLKLKVGLPSDLENLDALRRAAPKARIRVDANEAWKTPGEALKNIEAFAQDPLIECVEQPMPRDTSDMDKSWLKARSPLPLMADESYLSSADANIAVEHFDWVNVKLVKTGGPFAAARALQKARELGLKTMIGCMIESSLLISCAAHLMGLADTLDLDGAALSANDPFDGAVFDSGTIDRAPLIHGSGIGAVAKDPSFLTEGWQVCR